MFAISLDHRVADKPVSASVRYLVYRISYSGTDKRLVVEEQILIREQPVDTFVNPKDYYNGK